VSGPTKAELAEQLAATRAELDRANAAVLGQERRLMALGQAEHHPRCTKGGEQVLIGDHLWFGDPEADPETWVEGQVAEIVGTAAVVTTIDGATWRFGECVELISRGRLPRPERV
jgi:hypothetical protein